MKYHHRTPTVSALILVFAIVFSPLAFSWVYPEHRDIVLVAVQGMDEQHRQMLDQLWMQARMGNESRLCAAAADATQGDTPQCIDFAAWAAIAGDHSRSSADMANIILKSDWIMDVAEITAKLKTNLASSENRSERVNHLRTSDIQLQRADPDYATRAGSNNVHFLLPRPQPGTPPSEYLVTSITPGTEINAIGMYAYYHVLAIEKATRFARESLGPEAKASLALAILSDEAFALHFLEDTFAAGHVAGTWGNASQRKGTHDYYNERGLEVVTWAGEHAILVGDAYMRTEDAIRAGNVIRKSLEQVLDAANGIGTAGQVQPPGPVSLVPDTFDVTVNNIQPRKDVDTTVFVLLRETLPNTPVPALRTGLGEYPRFRAELGPFIGFSGGGRAATNYGGYVPSQQSVGLSGAIEAAFRGGLGLDGVMNESGDGLVFLEVGVRHDRASTTQIVDNPQLDYYGDLLSAIPARTGFAGRLRLPFWLIPGDLLVAGPILFFISPQTVSQMAVQAGNGGLIPWQSGISTGIGRFQFVLGREVGVSLFGYGSEPIKILAPYQGNVVVAGYRAIQFDFPVLEYRPFRTFSLNQSSSLVFQLYAGFDIPDLVDTEFGPVPESVESNLRTVWNTGLRISFDWRSYF